MQQQPKEIMSNGRPRIHGHEDQVNATSDDLHFDTPNVARVYDYLLGGQNYLPVDRDAAKKIRAVFPGLADAALANRAFHGRAARCMAGQGIRQYVDLGCGLPMLASTRAGLLEVIR